ncbi:hypothetical protein K458DRAFT_22226 [Lentithecium fluviatile CBS 122367]|uniref:Uncharacterized protein n=1 Tax=Lentithecium fluviatile CBS 122367 TaxID=1168545 RepID=A0A6G1J4W3_9PLEO|nr:hypothetical protein K458DRAFT_22226 [Lentithecium fluviatile CBS 122367]
MMVSTNTSTTYPNPTSASYSPQQSGHLLRLPRELRDMIYTYALTHPENIYYYRDEPYKAIFCSVYELDRVVSSVQLSPAPWNQLQYVCRQLRQETFGSEFTHNALVFNSHEGAGEFMNKLSSVQFLGFLDMCHETWQKRITRVILKNASFRVTPKKVVFDLYLIVYWCHLHPHTTVYLEDPLNYPYGHRDHPAGFLVDGMMLTAAFRHVSKPRGYVNSFCSELGLHIDYWHVQFYRQQWRPDFESKYVWRVNDRSGRVEIEGENFRLIPEDGPFDEEAFRRELEKLMEGGEIKKGKKVGEKWVELARGWYERGI